MYNNFDEIVNKMVTPEQNDIEFFKLLLSSDIAPVEKKYMFTSNFHYDLNPNGKEDLTFFERNVRIKANTFLNSLRRLSKQEIQSKYSQDFISFMNFLSSISSTNYWAYCRVKRNPSLTKENNKFKAIISEYERITGDKHGFDFNPASVAWYYFRSSSISPGIKDSFHSDDVKHRLYISINYDQLINLSQDFISKLEQQQIPYVFKIKSCKSSGRCAENDTIVIYADSEERITAYVNILEGLINENEIYRKSIHVPSAHLGNIDNLIGYGREFSKNDSYSGVVGKIALSATIYALKDIPETRTTLKNYKREEMLEIMERMKIYSHWKDVYELFKDRFWEKYYELSRQAGYNIEDSICFREREGWTK